MSESVTDLVIQISTSELEPNSAARTGRSHDNRLVAELRRCFQPGAEIALMFEGYVAITSILWLSDQADRSMRAGVRLLRVSTLPAGPPGAIFDQVGSPTTPVTHRPVTHQHP